MSNDAPKDPAHSLPPYAFLILAALGVGGVGFGGAVGGAYASTADLQRVEAKVDRLADMVLDLRVTLARRDRERGQ